MKQQSLVRSFFSSTIGRRARQLIERRVIHGFVESCARKPLKKALLAYLVSPLLPPPRLRDRLMFSNRGIAQELAHGLNEMGYSVDIVNFDNPAWVPSSRYDLFLGHGGHQFHRLSATTRGPKLYFSTGTYWRLANTREAQRLYDLTLRTGYLLPPDRVINQDEDSANREADGILCLGNRVAADTYAGFPNVAHLNNAIFPLDHIPEKTHLASRRGFLFFAGRGNVHKGLDLLLEAFEGLGADLHVCQHIEPGFSRVYQRALRSLPNVHVHSFVQMRSPQFSRIAAQCSWCILPTCSEGQPGSVLECMAYGLIPVLPTMAHIDLDDFGIALDSCSIQGIRDTVQRCLSIPAQECAAKSRAAEQATVAKYSATIFRASLQQSVDDLLLRIHKTHP